MNLHQIMCLHPNAELGKAPAALDFVEKECLFALETTPHNEVQLKGHSAHSCHGRLGISLLFILRMT